MGGRADDHTTKFEYNLFKDQILPYFHLFFSSSSFLTICATLFSEGVMR